MAARLQLTGDALKASPWSFRTASGAVEPVDGETIDTVDIAFRPGTVDEVVLQVRCLVTKATSYDLLLGQEIMFPPGVCIDNWTEQAIYRPDWKTGGLHLAYMPLDLHS